MHKNSLYCILIFLSTFLLFPTNSHADCQGCCSHHGGVCCIDGVTKCCDGTPLSQTCREKGCDVCNNAPSNDSSGGEYSDDGTEEPVSTTIRLYGIDCPESDQNYGSDATAFTNDQILGVTVEINSIDTDLYGRTVAIVNYNGQCLNERLIANGWAWVYDSYCSLPDCNEWETIEAEARSKNIGLWESANPIPPWEWRNSAVTGTITASSPVAASDGNVWSATVTDVLDGDTIKVESGSSGTSDSGSSSDGGCFVRSVFFPSHAQLKDGKTK